MDTLALWNSVEKTDPAFTKGFKRGGGFSGTAISPMYLIRRATELWGPMGGEWGVDVVSETILDGAPLLNSREEVVGHEKVHEVRILLRYPQGVVPAVGQTMLVTKNKHGFVTDEEAPKKSLTDALSKAMSWLGFSADVHMGRYDDNKYINDLKREFGADANKAILSAKILPTDGAGDCLTESRRQELNDLAGEYIQAWDEGKSIKVIKHFYSLDNDEQIYMTKLLAGESKMRAAIKANSPHKETA